MRQGRRRRLGQQRTRRGERVDQDQRQRAVDGEGAGCLGPVAAEHAAGWMEAEVRGDSQHLVGGQRACRHRHLERGAAARQAPHLLVCHRPGGATAPHHQEAAAHPACPSACRLITRTTWPPTTASPATRPPSPPLPGAAATTAAAGRTATSRTASAARPTSSPHSARPPHTTTLTPNLCFPPCAPRASPPP